MEKPGEDVKKKPKTFWEHCFNKEKPFSINYWVEMMEKVTSKEQREGQSPSATGSDILTWGWELWAAVSQTSEVL